MFDRWGTERFWYAHIKNTCYRCSLLAGLLFFMRLIFQPRARLAKPANGKTEWGRGDADLNCHLLDPPSFVDS